MTIGEKRNYSNVIYMGFPCKIYEEFTTNGWEWILYGFWSYPAMYLDDFTRFVLGNTQPFKFEEYSGSYFKFMFNKIFGNNKI